MCFSEEKSNITTPLKVFKTLIKLPHTDTVEVKTNNVNFMFLNKIFV